jgi:uncharacterized membrane protein
MNEHLLLRNQALALSLILILGLGVRLYKLSEKSMYFDEVYTLKFAENPIRDIPSKIVRDDAPPLYHFILNLWMNVSKTTFWLRFLSVLFGVGTILATYELTKELFGTGEALLASFFVSTSLLALVESQEVRSYTLLSFLSTMSVIFFYKSLQENKSRNWIVFICFTFLSLFTHYFAFLVLLAESLFFLVFWNKHKRILKNFALSMLALFACYLPWMIFFIRNAGDCWRNAHIAGILPHTQLGTTVILYQILGFFSNSKYLIPIFLGLSIKAIFEGYKHNKYHVVLLSILLIVPFMISLTLVKSLHAKHLISTLPFYYILAAKGFTSIRNKKLQLLVFFIVLSITSVKIYGYFYKEDLNIGDWKSTAAFLEENYKPGDIILVEPSTESLSLMYYLKKDDSIIHGVTETTGLPLETQKALSEIKHKRAWIVFTDEYDIFGLDREHRIRSWLDKNSVNKTRFKWITVYLLNSTSTRYTANYILLS